MCQCVVYLIISKSGKLFFDSYIIKAAIKDKKVHTSKLQISINRTTYTQKLNHTYNHAKNASAKTFLNLKKLYIELELLFFGKK